MSDFDDDGRRIPDEDGREEAHPSHNRTVRCPQCEMAVGMRYPASPHTYECPGEPGGVDVYEGAIESKNGYLFCSAECLRIYT